MPPAEAGGDRSSYLLSPPPFPFSFHVLEVTVISAQDLYPAARSMRTFAVAYVHPDHQMRTRLDAAGHTDPSWNDKFVFRVEDAALRSDTSAITVDIYAKSSGFIIPGGEAHIGTARALLSTLRPTKTTRFVALQVRRPRSLRPQGIVNIGFALIDAYVRSLPLYAELTPPAAALGHDGSASPKPVRPRAKSSRTTGDRRKRPPAAAAPPDRRPAMSREEEELERKLKMWREELPNSRPHPVRPDHERGERRKERRPGRREERREGRREERRPPPVEDKETTGGWLSPSFKKFSCFSGGNVESGEFIPAARPRFVQERPGKHNGVRLHAMDW